MYLYRLNRTTVECKLYSIATIIIHYIWLNRTTVECKLCIMHD